MSKKVLAPEMAAIRDRIIKRLKAMKLTMAEAERRAGLNRARLQQLMSRSKASMKGDSLLALATTLGTTQTWLLTGRGPEEVIADPDSYKMEMPEQLGELRGSISFVGPIWEMSIAIKIMSNSTGECGFSVSGAQIERGMIVDPAVLIPDNCYFSSFSSGRQIRCQTKECILSDGRKITFILNALDET